MLSKDQYLEVLHGLELQLWRHADPWGNLMGGSSVQTLRRDWEALAGSFKKDFPEAREPLPFWRLRREPIWCIVVKDRRSRG